MMLMLFHMFSLLNPLTEINNIILFHHILCKINTYLNNRVVGERLKELIYTFYNKIYDKEQHLLKIFFDSEWNTIIDVKIILIVLMLFARMLYLILHDVSSNLRIYLYNIINTSLCQLLILIIIHK